VSHLRPDLVAEPAGPVVRFLTVVGRPEVSMRRTSRLIVLVVALGGLAQGSAAQERPDPQFHSEVDVSLDKGTRFVAALAFGAPLGAAASLRILHGLGADVREEEGSVKAVCALPIRHCAQGFLFEAAAGSGGGELGLGIGARAHVSQEGFRGTAGASLRVSLARTWGSPIATEPGLTYLGPELELSGFHASLNLGILWRVSGEQGASTLFSWAVGIEL